MNAASQMVSKISSELEQKLGIATDVTRDYAVFGDTSTPQKITLDLADSTKQTAARDNLKAVVERETRAKMAGKAEADIVTAINDRMSKIERASCRERV